MGLLHRREGGCQVTGQGVSEAKSDHRRSRRPRTARTWQIQQLLTKSALYLILVVGAVAMLVPLLWLVSTSLKSPHEVFRIPIQWFPEVLRWDNYVRLFQVTPFGRYIANTVLITVVGVLGNLVGSSIAAYAFARMRFRGRDVMFFVMVATMMVPIWATIIPSFIIFSRIGWIDTYLPILVPAFFAVPFSTFLLRQFFLGIPLEIEEAARIDGASTLRIFLTIVLPMSKPALLTVVIFSFLAHWEDFLRPLIYLNSQELYPVSLGIANFIGTQQSELWLTMAAATLALLPPIALFVVAQKWFIQGIVVSGVKG